MSLLSLLLYGTVVVCHRKSSKRRGIKTSFKPEKSRKIQLVTEIKTKQRSKFKIIQILKKKVTASFDFLSEIDKEPSRPTFTVDLRLSETQGRYDILKSQLNSI